MWMKCSVAIQWVSIEDYGAVGRGGGCKKMSSGIECNTIYIMCGFRWIQGNTNLVPDVYNKQKQRIHDVDMGQME